MGKVNVSVINAHEIQYPDGRIVWRSSHPIEEPPAGKVWHPALARPVPEEQANTSFETEIDEG